MSAVFLDPVAMDATAGAISEHAREVDAAIGDLQTACDAEVPPSLAGWLTEELRDITLHARLAQLLYVVAALETALRAEQIRADQSLAAAISAMGAPVAAFSAGGVVLGAPSGSSYVGPSAPATGFVLDMDPAFTPSGNGYLLNNVPTYHPVTPGTYSGGVSPSGNNRIVEEQATTLQLIGMEAKSWSALNRSMSRF
ncbi:hypothetical protein EXE59_00735 [Nocardioides eburneiflavus]|uniref:Uncharacterized protein n=1 Tax=Nocardioides eburneiflavus TaxID=2518372 RepID=A0A4Z1C1T1_9ACTN|nr:hypothetical protein [Nocardioides eburneiflavus]TGN62642.1 hypothetical protein EXE59_00735 [Nocardioides eburneiflavus]